MLRTAPRLLIGLAALALLGGCSDSVDPTLGTAQAFSLYGYLDPSADRQALRVAPIVGTIVADTARTLAATVTSEELGTGRTVAWRDSFVSYRDGSTGHVFVADYTPTPGATVEVRVAETTGEGRVTAVRISVPTLDRPEIGSFLGTSAEVTYPIRVRAPRVLTTSLVYRVVGLRSAPMDTVAVSFSDFAPFEDAGGGTWGLDLPFVATSRAFLSSPAAEGATLRLVDVAVRAFVTGPEWDIPAGGLDEDRIVEPGTFSNVTGGFGFVGSGYWTESRWTPSLTTQSRAGFLVDTDPASVLRINEVSAQGWVELYNPTLEFVPIGGYRISSEGQANAFPSGTAVPPLGFQVLQVAPSLADGRVVLESPAAVEIVETGIRGLSEITSITIGSFPDGRTRLIGEFPEFRGFNLFQNRLVATPGAPNRPLSFLAMINEVFSAGTDGWAEILAPPGVTAILVTDDPERPLSMWVPAVREGDRWIANETPGRFDLPQTGGEVYVAVLVRDVPPRVYDARTYGPQTPERSSGTLPDGDRDAWRPDLLPTRASPNAAPSRLASR